MYYSDSPTTHTYIFQVFSASCGQKGYLLVEPEPCLRNSGGAPLIYLGNSSEQGLKSGLENPPLWINPDFFRGKYNEPLSKEKWFLNVNIFLGLH